MTEQDPISSLHGGRYPLYIYASISFKRISDLTNASNVTVKPSKGPFIFLLPYRSSQIVLFVFLYEKKEKKEKKRKRSCIFFISPIKSPDKIKETKVQYKLLLRYNLLFKPYRIIEDN